jgi:hypothetical protein
MVPTTPPPEAQDEHDDDTAHPDHPCSEKRTMISLMPMKRTAPTMGPMKT